MEKPTSKIIWLDWLRVFATLAVILVHTGANLNKQFGQIDPIDWWAANFWQGVSRFCVPIFFMISGVTVLGRELSMKDHFKKPFIRILLPFLFWHCAYMLFNWIVRLKAKPLDFWQAIKWTGGQFQNYSSYHFWYIYTLIGIYCVLPILNKWINRASKSEIEVILGIWLLTFLVNNEALFGWKFRIDLPYNSGYIGYMILGNYLFHHAHNSTFIKRLSIFLFLLGIGLILFPTYWVTQNNGNLDLRFYSNYSPGVFFESVGLFLMAKSFQWEWQLPALAATRNFVSLNSYGIYCAHLLGLFYLAKIGIHFYVFQPFLGIPVTAVSCLLVCGLIVWTLKKNPFGNYIAG